MSEIRTPAEEPAHDVLAAEAFAMPAPDPRLHHGPVVLPDDPTGITEPHDVLAAEEFALPSAWPSSGSGALTQRSESSARLRSAGAALLTLVALRWIRRRAHGRG